MEMTKEQADEAFALLQLRDGKYVNGHTFGCPRTMTGADCYCGFEDDYLRRKNNLFRELDVVPTQ